MLREKWAILVNLCPDNSFTSRDSQLLGVLIISQIIQAADSLTRNGWKGRHYLYIDEIGRFDTQQIDDILASRRHIGLSLIIAHQFFKQVENQRTLNSIMQNARVKVMFNCEYQERELMAKALNYGGQITPQMAAFANKNLPRQHAIIRKNKQPPVRVMTPDVHIPNVDTTNYIKKLLKADWYLTRNQIKEQINARLTSKPAPRAKHSQYGKASNSKPAGQGDVSKRVRPSSGSVGNSSLPPDNQKPTKPTKPKTGGF